MEISKKRVLITGGTGSVGQALVQQFCEHEYDVTFQYYSNELIAEQLEKTCGAKGIQIDFLSDFTLTESKFDILVNNAGVNITDAMTHEVSISDWWNTMQINLTVPFILTKVCLPHMMGQGEGRIVNISSIYGLRAVEGNCPYTTSKHGLSGLTKTVAKEYAEYGITCNEICPGPIESEMMNRISRREAELSLTAPEDYLRDVCQGIPKRRMAYPKEIASLALYLVSDAAKYITGVSIPVDGGMIIT